MKRIIKFLFTLLVIIFFITFVNRNNYYESSYTLSNESIKAFENDLRHGKNINPNNYLPKKKDYSNKYSNLFIKISKSIEIVVDKSLRRFLKYLENWQITKNMLKFALFFKGLEYYG